MQGKTYLTAIFCVVRCILYPGSKIVVCSSTRTQANEVLLKITEDLCKNYDWGSVNLNREISYSSVGANHAVIEFHNGSWIRVVTASDSGRGARSNVLVEKLPIHIEIYERNWAISVEAKLVIICRYRDN